MAGAPNDSPYSADELAAAKAQIEQNPPNVAGGIDGGQLASAMPAASPADVDVAQLLAMVQRMQAQISDLQAGKGLEGEHPLIGTAKSARDLLATHYQHNTTADGGPVLRMADDLVDASSNAVESGDVGPVRTLGEKFARLLRKHHPGPGDHHYYNQAVDFATEHLGDAADLVTGPAPRPAGELQGKAAPATQVVQGSVTGGGTSSAHGVFAKA